MSALEIASPRWLLVKTCQDLVGKAQTGDAYAKLRMAGLIRHLLVGQHALLVRATEAGEPAPVFWFREPPEGDAWTSADGFDASRRAPAEGEVRKTDRDAFLAARIARFGDWYSVAQLLAAVEHFYGGAPSMGLEGVTRPAMMALDEALRTRTNTVLVALQEVSGVTLRALMPFAESLPRRETPKEERPVAPTGSACPFAGKISLD